MFRPKEEDEHIILFVKMAKESNLTDELKKKLAVAIRNMMSPRHVPNAVYTVPDIPASLDLFIYCSFFTVYELRKEGGNGSQADNQWLSGAEGFLPAEPWLLRLLRTIPS